MNNTAKFLMTLDIIIFAGLGISIPILSFLVDGKINDGDIFNTGFAIAIFLFFRAILQSLFSNFGETSLYRNRRNYLIMSVLFVLGGWMTYFYGDSVLLIFVAQAIYGIASGLTHPAWKSLWDANIGKSFCSDWSFYLTLLGLDVAFSLGIFSALETIIGRNELFGLINLLFIAGIVLIFFMDNRKHKVERFLR